MKAEEKKFLVFGTGKSGVAAAELLLRHEADVVLCDSRADLDIEDFKEKHTALAGISVVAGELPDEIADQVDIVILSPGVPCDLPVVNRLRDAGKIIWGEVELAWQMGRGTVAAITDQRQKNPENAPANASYLLIRAVRGSKVLAYYIYLGGNNTSDFNVRANVHYRFNILILGDSEVDTRISSYAVNVHDTYEENSVGGYCTYNPFQMLAVEIDGSPAPLTLRGRIGVAQGNAGAFCLNGSPVGEGRDLTLPEQPGPNVFGVNYAPGIYTTVNSQVVYTVTVEDDAGFAQSFDIGHRFANRLDVYIHSATAENGNGTVTVAGACMTLNRLS